MKKRYFTGSALLLALVLTVAIITSAAATTVGAQELIDTNPAINVAQKTAKSVVGVITNEQSWNRQTAETVEQMIGQGSGVVIRDGGYILTNNHVVSSGSSYQVILPSGDKVDAKLVGADQSTDIAVLKVETSEELVPATIGSVENMPVGSTVIAIGNPGGEVLANTVTSGIISALERTIDTTGTMHGATTREISYIQHDAAISSGSSGGGLYDINGNLIGINTLKYAGNVFSSSTYEGLGFAIPMNVAEPIVNDLIDYGKVLRPQMGVMVTDNQGPDEPMNKYPPAAIMIAQVNPGSPAEAAGIKPYDFITAIDGTRVKTLRELTKELDKHKEGDVVELTIVRYNNAEAYYVSQKQQQSYYQDGNSGDGSEYYYGNPFSDFFGQNPYGNYGGGNTYSQPSTVQLNGFEELKVNVTLKVLE